MIEISIENDVEINEK